MTRTINTILADIRKTIPTKYELDYFLTHQDRYRYILHQIAKLHLPKKAKVLEIGSYPPHLFHAFEQMGFEVYGISSKHEPMKQKNIVSLNIEEDSLPFKKQMFDLVVFSEVIEHLIVDPTKYLEKINHILKPGGKLIITTPNAAGLHKLVPIVMGRSTYFPLSELFNTRIDDGSIYLRHNREYTKRELIEMLERAGFRVVNAHTFVGYGPFRERLIPDPIHKKLIKMGAYMLTSSAARLRDTLYIEATPK